MMIGQTIKISATKFTRTYIGNLRKKVRGAPIIVDDLTNKRFADHAPEIIKYDDFGLEDSDMHYPAVVISANEDVKVINSELVRRMVVCHVQGSLTNMESMNSNIVDQTQANIGTAFYREYLRIMLERLSAVTAQLKSAERDVTPPDIFAVSSEVLCALISKHSGKLPRYARKLTFENYFDEKVTGAAAIRKIRAAWNTDADSFVIDKKRNQLRYNVGDAFEAERLRKELSEELEAERMKEWIHMRLDVANRFFGVEFKKGWLW